MVKTTNKKGLVEVVEEYKEVRYINPYKMFVGAFIPNWLLERKEVSQGAKLCYARLCEYAGEKGECFPAQNTLAKDIGVASSRQIRRYIDELIGLSLIITVKIGFQGRNVYKFLYHEWMGMYLPKRTDMSALKNPKRTDMSAQRGQICPSLYKEKTHIKESSIYVENIFNHWNSLKIIKHRDLSKFKPLINTVLKNYSMEEIERAMDNYALVLKGNEYFWSYKWSLNQFLDLKSGIDRFIPENFNNADYLKNTPVDAKAELNGLKKIDELIKNELGVIAGENRIVAVLKSIDEKYWYRVKRFLEIRYQFDINGPAIWAAAERRARKEMYSNIGEVNSLVETVSQSIGGE